MPWAGNKTSECIQKKSPSSSSAFARRPCKGHFSLMQGVPEAAQRRTPPTRHTLAARAPPPDTSQRPSSPKHTRCLSPKAPRRSVACAHAPLQHRCAPAAAEPLRRRRRHQLRARQRQRARAPQWRSLPQHTTCTKRSQVSPLSFEVRIISRSGGGCANGMALGGNGSRLVQ